jgi:hypothetical protein
MHCICIQRQHGKGGVGLETEWGELQRAKSKVRQDQTGQGKTRQNSANKVRRGEASRGKMGKMSRRWTTRARLQKPTVGCLTPRVGMGLACKGKEGGWRASGMTMVQERQLTN